MTARLHLKPAAIGVGMTGQRVRDRLIERLREGAHNGGDIRDERVLNAIRTVPRHLFVDEALAARAYEDNALPIGHGQTISQPWVVAKMTESLFLDGAQPKRVLEVGTGSGYQAAVLAALGLEVHTVERIGDLLRIARKRFRTLGLNVRSKHDDGRIGWPEHAPFDAIVVTAGAPALEDALVDFVGCAVVISHDRWFLDRIATHILAFEGNSEVVWHEGNYASYIEDLKRRKGADADQPHRVAYKKLVRA